MPKIILTDDQVKQFTAAQQPIQLCDSQGHVLGIVPPIWNAEEVADAERRVGSEEPRSTTAQVLEKLRSLP
jgi:hypothetical protein